MGTFVVILVAVSVVMCATLPLKVTLTAPDRWNDVSGANGRIGLEPRRVAVYGP